MPTPQALQMLIATYLDKCNPTLQIVANTFDIVVDRELTEDLILNSGAKLKELVFIRMKGLLHVLPVDIWQATLERDLN
ncbi:hypothetical protein ABDK00_013220 [Niabella insulamsoli]|uniref:hypothetical protein n=1 Tax=Niabella insulamsoli TaxID=3144874 RepID=UPI0031FBC76C